MKSVYSLLASAFTLAAGSIHAAPPFRPQYVEAFVAGRQTDATTTKLRITAVNSEAPSAETVALGSIAACTASACYRVAGATAALSLPNTSSGTSAQIVEMAVPRQPILSIHIEGGTGSNVIPSTVALPGPLDLSLSTAGGEVLLVFKQGGAKSPKFSPVSSASGLLRDHGISVYYHPSSTTTKILPGGVEIVIPAAATVAPQIFNVAVLDTGDAYPMLDIFPPMKLLKRGTLTMPAPMKGVAKGASAANGTDATVRTQKSFGETGVVRPSAAADLPQSKTVSGNASSVTSTTACAQALSQAYLQIIQTMGFTGVVYTTPLGQIFPTISIYATSSDTLGSREFVDHQHLLGRRG